nr:ribosomal protein L32 [Chloropicon mariensis]
MAVPKKRKSKSKTKIRKFTWKRKALDEAKKSIALSKALLKENPTRFIYND